MDTRLGLDPAYIWDPTWLLLEQMVQTPACIRDPASIWDPACIRSFTVCAYDWTDTPYWLPLFVQCECCMRHLSKLHIILVARQCIRNVLCPFFIIVYAAAEAHTTNKLPSNQDDVTCKSISMWRSKVSYSSCIMNSIMFSLLMNQPTYISVLCLFCDRDPDTTVVVVGCSYTHYL